MARAALLLMLLGVGLAAAQPNRAQQCIPLGGPLIASCQKELDFLNKPENFPLTSTEAPDENKVKSVVDSLPSDLPTKPCCDAVEKFDAAGCGCEASLSSTLKAVGLESSPQGLQGVTRIAATACDFEAFKCD